MDTKTNRMNKISNTKAKLLFQFAERWLTELEEAAPPPNHTEGEWMTFGPDEEWYDLPPSLAALLYLSALGVTQWHNIETNRDALRTANRLRKELGQFSIQRAVFIKYLRDEDLYEDSINDPVSWGW